MKPCHRCPAFKSLVAPIHIIDHGTQSAQIHLALASICVIGGPLGASAARTATASRRELVVGMRRAEGGWADTRLLEAHATHPDRREANIAVVCLMCVPVCNWPVLDAGRHWLRNNRPTPDGWDVPLAGDVLSL